MSASRFSFEAREWLAGRLLTTRDWALAHGYAGASEWRGDRCGCTDDRCIGYHHDEQDDCLCRVAMFRDFLEAEDERRKAVGWPSRRA